MALTESKLEEAFSNTLEEEEAIATFVDTWGSYFYDASVSGVPCAAGSLDSALTAMESALEGMSEDGAFPALLQSALVTFWGFLSTNAVSIWILAPNTPGPVTPPPTLASLATSMEAVLTTNEAITDTEDIEEAYSNLAGFIHSNAGLGGICTVTTPAPASSPVSIL